MCRECGGNWTQEQLWTHAVQPYISLPRLLLWTFGMPVIHSVVAVFWACSCLAVALSFDRLISGEFFTVASLGGLVGGAVLLGYWNRETAGRWASRMTQAPVYGGVRSGRWYWGTLLTITAVQMVCTLTYPLICLLILFELTGF
ncbi:MAG: hypothetical protein AAF333_17905 [Planctomycetota bacterium]